MTTATKPTSKPAGWRAVFPHPVLSLQLGITWLVLSHSVELVHWLSALLLAWAVPKLIHPFLGEAARLHWPSLVRLVGVLGNTFFSSTAKNSGVVDYSDYKLGADVSLGDGYTFGVAYVGATKKGTYGDINKSRLVLTLSKAM